MGKITREDRIGVTGGKELELSPLSEGIWQQSLVQIKPWPTHQNNRCWITCWSCLSATVVLIVCGAI